MNISYSWLKDYIKVDLSAEKIANILTSIGLEVGKIEKHESVKGGLEGLVIGKVLTCNKHENSDHLHVTTVDIGQSEPLQIVCGAPNIAVGQTVVVATIGTTLYSEDSSFVIKRSKIRGVESFGMICSEDEIGMGFSHAGIMVLPNNIEAGYPAKMYFDVATDQILEVDITPNRADAISHWGVARDLAAYCMVHNIEHSLCRTSIDKYEQDNNNFCIEVEVENSEQCPRYSGVTLTGVEVAESPVWLKNRILSIGLRPINNIVDVSNFVLHALGQPIHIFDADKIIGKKIVVKNAEQGKKFTTLDGVQRELSKADLMICNAQEPMCIGGVFGGIDSGVTSQTKNIFIESAYFNPTSIRKTARRHGLSTDSSFRFERGADINQTIMALQYAALLIKDIAKGKISQKIVDIYPKKIDNHRVELALQKIYSLVGAKIEVETIEQIFSSLQIKIVEKGGDSPENILYSLEVPSYRVDVVRDIDVIEDILRIYGYNNVEISDRLTSNIVYSQKPNSYKLQDTISEQLTANGFFEIMNNSLTKSTYYQNLSTYRLVNNVNILNPLSNDLSVMRQTLLFGGLESLAHNINRQKANLKFYEFGNCYSYMSDKQEKSNALSEYVETAHLGIWLTGNRTEQSWLRKEEKVTFYDLKAHVQNIFTRLGIKIKSLRVEEFSNDIFAQAIEYKLHNNKKVAVVGLVAQPILEYQNISQDVFFADLEWDTLLEYNGLENRKLEDVSKFPQVSRDLALLLNKDVVFDSIVQIARKTESKLLQSVILFDVYEGKNIDSNKKSYAVNFVFEDKTKTLTDKQIDAIMSNLLKNFENELGAKLR